MLLDINAGVESCGLAICLGSGGVQDWHDSQGFTLKVPMQKSQDTSVLILIIFLIFFTAIEQLIFWHGVHVLTRDWGRVRLQASASNAPSS